MGCAPTARYGKHLPSGQTAYPNISSKDSSQGKIYQNNSKIDPYSLNL